MCIFEEDTYIYITGIMCDDTCQFLCVQKSMRGVLGLFWKIMYQCIYIKNSSLSPQILEKKTPAWSAEHQNIQYQSEMKGGMQVGC